MDREFWLQKWERNEIGFHEPAGNRLLQRYWSAAGVPAGATVLVPLCGKSMDMLWLARQGYRVLGVELSEQAVQAFFAEHGLMPKTEPAGPFRRWRAEGIEILQGDLFALTPEHAPAVAGLYDRAALIALPKSDRLRYAQVLQRCLDRQARGLIVAMDYQPATEIRPPFSVSPEEVAALFAPVFRTQPLVREDVLAAEAKLAARGLTALHEAAYALLPAA